jgi:hypothetical protein
MKKLVGSAVAVAVVVLGTFTAAPASAHPGHWIYTTNWYAWAAYQGESITVCADTLRPGYAVAHFRNQPSGPVHHTGTTTDCLTERHPTVYDFRVCHSDDGCSPWHRRD